LVSQSNFGRVIRYEKHKQAPAWISSETPKQTNKQTHRRHSLQTIPTADALYTWPLRFAHSIRRHHIHTSLPFASTPI